jgi:hypothetical protein
VFQKFGIVIACLSAISASASMSAGSAALTVSVEPTGSYSVMFPLQSWEFRGELGVPLLNVVVRSGADGAGAFQEIAFDFVTDTVRHASMRAYTERPAVLFTCTAEGATVNAFAFPAFSRYPSGLDHITYSGIFAPPSFSALSEESPWIFFDGAYNTFILSAASNFMVSSTRWSAKGELASGIAQSIPALPAGFEHRTLLAAGRGINRTFDAWGEALTALSGKRRPPNDADASLNQLGYWTDNGATYYYQTAKSMSYEQTLAAIRNDFDRMGVGLGYIQLDSWFYPKGANALWSNNGHGIYEYVAASPPFSAGLAAFQRLIGVPLITHARWIDPVSPYRSSYRMSGNVVLDRNYWETVAAYLANSGVVTYEQDWLADKAQTDFNLTDGAEFMDNMAAAMAGRNLTMQYCMASPRHFLQSSRYSNLTTIRTSADRLGRDRWHDFLYTSRLASALGIWPFTDNFNSTETTHLLMATLSAGPVGVGDPVGRFSTVNLLRAARKDGVIVKPDVPLTPIDRSYADMAHGTGAPQISATYSDFGDLRAWYLFAYSEGPSATVRFSLSDVGAGRPVYLYDYAAGAGKVTGVADAVEREIQGEALYLIAAPIGDSGMAILGDLGQFVSLGRKRIPLLSDDGRVRLTVAFASGESERTIHGYSPVAPLVEAIDGGVGEVRWNPATRLFAIPVSPGQAATATILIRRSHPRSRFEGQR